jgi:uncharacterized protein YjbJ (UPF0337 family)
VEKALGDDGMALRGEAERLAGQADEVDAKAGQRLQATVDRALGKVEHVVGALVGNEELEAEGKSREAAVRAARGA